jgi:hypothetical protein
MPGYFFERDDDRLDLREREALLDLRAPVDLRPVLPLAEVRERDLPPALLRVLRAGFARRDALFAVLFFEALLAALFDEPFVSPACWRCLFTVRAASSSARSRLAPRLRADCLIFWY